MKVEFIIILQLRERPEMGGIKQKPKNVLILGALSSKSLHDDAPYLPHGSSKDLVWLCRHSGASDLAGNVTLEQIETLLPQHPFLLHPRIWPNLGYHSDYRLEVTGPNTVRAVNGVAGGRGGIIPRIPQLECPPTALLGDPRAGVPNTTNDMPDASDPGCRDNPATQLRPPNLRIESFDPAITPAQGCDITRCPDIES